MGRDLAFLCCITDYKWSNAPRGIAVDEQTALLIDEYVTATVVGSNDEYFLEAPGIPEVCKSKTPLTYEGITVYRIKKDTCIFDLNTWEGDGCDAYSVSATDGVLISTQADGSPY